MKSKMHEMFQPSEKSEKEGIWQSYGEFKVLLARAGGTNKAYQKTMERIARPYRRQLQTESMDNDLGEDLLRQGFAEVVVLDWMTKVDGEFTRGILDANGELLPFNKENVLRTFVELPDLFEDIQTQARNSSLYRQSVREDAEKNS